MTKKTKKYTDYTHDIEDLAGSSDEDSTLSSNYRNVKIHVKSSACGGTYRIRAFPQTVTARSTRTIFRSDSKYGTCLANNLSDVLKSATEQIDAALGPKKTFAQICDELRENPIYDSTYPGTEWDGEESFPYDAPKQTPRFVDSYRQCECVLCVPCMNSIGPGDAAVGEPHEMIPWYKSLLALFTRK